MFVNPLHRLTDREPLFLLMASRPLGAWVCHGRDGLVANHVPFLLDRSRGPLGTLIGHVARANTVWRELGSTTPSLVMFQGPQAYITPGWYPGKAEHGRVVPTWNYGVAHAHGVARAIEHHHPQRHACVGGPAERFDSHRFQPLHGGMEVLRDQHAHRREAARHAAREVHPRLRRHPVGDFLRQLCRADGPGRGGRARSTPSGT